MCVGEGKLEAGDKGGRGRGRCMGVGIVMLLAGSRDHRVESQGEGLSGQGTGGRRYIAGYSMVALMAVIRQVTMTRIQLTGVDGDSGRIVLTVYRTSLHLLLIRSSTKA